MGVGCPCPPVRNDIVTPRHLFLSNSKRIAWQTKSVTDEIAKDKKSFSKFFSQEIDAMKDTSGNNRRLRK